LRYICPCQPRAHHEKEPRTLEFLHRLTTLATLIFLVVTGFHADPDSVRTNFVTDSSGAGPLMTDPALKDPSSMSPCRSRSVWVLDQVPKKAALHPEIPRIRAIPLLGTACICMNHGIYF
jgi:hypothetical protein